MSLLEAVVLGLVQGLTEFTPVSSSGHLVLARWATGWGTGSAELDKAFDVAVHAGTLVGSGAYLRSDVVAIVRAASRAVRTRRRPVGIEARAFLLVGAALPAALTAVVFDNFITERLGSPAMVGAALVAFGIALAACDRSASRRDASEFRGRDAAFMGVAQALALQPGVSRSGATICAARVIGFDRDSAARLSFLMALPLIAGAATYEGAKLVAAAELGAEFAGVMVAGASAAAITASVSVWGVLSVVRRRSFLPFVVYRVAIGTAVLVAVGTGIR